MPLLTVKDVGKKGKLALWHMTEPLDGLLKMKEVSEKDLSLLNTFPYDQRKKEWLVARILTEQLTREKADIIYDAHNKPFLKNSPAHISLSHSHDLLVVILDTAPTGIDIELIKPKVERIKRKFMSDAELNSLQDHHLAEQLTIYWCAKESLYKLYGKKELAFKENLPVEPFRYSEKGRIKGWIKNASVSKCFTLQYEKLNFGADMYMLAHVINED